MNALKSVARTQRVNSSTGKLNILNVHPLEVVSCYRNPQLQVGED